MPMEWYIAKPAGCLRHWNTANCCIIYFNLRLSIERVHKEPIFYVLWSVTFVRIVCLMSKTITRVDLKNIGSKFLLLWIQTSYAVRVCYNGMGTIYTVFKVIMQLADVLLFSLLFERYSSLCDYSSMPFYIAIKMVWLFCTDILRLIGYIRI